MYTNNEMAAWPGGAVSNNTARSEVAPLLRPAGGAPLNTPAHEQHFREAIAGAGLTPPEYIVSDGAIHRFSSDGRRRDDAGWYVFFLDGVATGIFGCWRLGTQQVWSSKSDREMSAAEKIAQQARLASMKEQRDAEARLRQETAKVKAEQRWEAAAPAVAHPYLDLKKIQPFGSRIENEHLLIPMRDIDGTLWSTQVISTTGEKRFQYGGRVNGCFCELGAGITDTLIVCEGFATGASLHEATGVSVAIAFTAGNLLAVAKALRAKHPACTIIVAADDDAGTLGNPGLTKATEAAAAVNGRMLRPVADWEGLGKVSIDFNDLHQHAGLDAVRRCVTAAQTASPPVIGATAHQDRKVVFVNGSDLRPEPIRWLWQNWLAAGKLHILAGAPGQGKTTIALTLAAAVTAGRHWPDGSRCPVGNILIWSGEDDPADTLLPRLLAAGAVAERCFFVQGTRIADEIQSFDPARDIAALEEQAAAIGGISLLIVDPIVSAVAGDGHKNNDVRRALQPLVDLASRLGAVALGITHFSKGGAGSDPASRVVGSVAFTAVARVVLVAAKTSSEDGKDRRILARAKSNIGPDDGGFEYQIEQSMPLPGIKASYVTWGQGVEGTAQELLQDMDDQPKEETNDAVEMLRAELASDCWTPMSEAIKPLLAAGFSKKQAWRASKKLNVRRQKGSMKEGWYWRLPGESTCPAVAPPIEHSDEDSEDASLENREPSESSAPVESSTGSAFVETFDDAEVF